MSSAAVRVRSSALLNTPLLRRSSPWAAYPRRLVPLPLGESPLATGMIYWLKLLMVKATKKTYCLWL
jgi:hypothetical protein